MKKNVHLYFLLSCELISSMALAGSGCTPPNEYFFHEKFKKWFHTDKLERELKEVVDFTPNYERREAIKSLNQNIYFADRFQEENIKEKIRSEFDGMINADPRRVGPMQNFPVSGAVSELSSGEGGSLQINTSGIPLEA